jgi:hypothetical protein
MMQILTRDITALPQSLLLPFRMHERIDDCGDDDMLIVDKLAMAIERIEIKTGIGIFAAQYQWTPDQWMTPSIRVPRPPVNTWTATVPGPIDVTGSYTLLTGGYGGEIAPAYLSGTWQSGLSLVITTGFTVAVGLSPGLRDLIFRVAGHLYEFREIYLATNLAMQSQWLDDTITGYWQPRI